MQKDNSTTQPLYKVLHDKLMGKSGYLSTDEYEEVKGKYQDLAEDNLHHLAEALRECMDEMEVYLGKEELEKSNPTGNPFASAYRKAKEALNRIS